MGTNQRDDLEQLVYSLFGNLADNLARRFQSLETVSQLHLALTDTFIKYALTALPEVPPSLMAAARARATKIYEQVNITAAREFQRRRESDAYSAAELGIEEEPSDSVVSRNGGEFPCPVHRCGKARPRKRASVRAGFGPAEFVGPTLSPPRVTGTAKNLFRLVRLVSRSPLGSEGQSPSASRLPASAKIIAFPAPRHRECPLCVRPDTRGMEGAWNLHRARERQGRPPAD